MTLTASQRGLLALAGAVLVGLLAPGSAAALATLHLDRLGPLRLHMTRTAALDTGWLSNRGPGCELGGPPLPIVYRLRGPRAPRGVVGSAEFSRGRLTGLAVTRGVRTALGIRAGRSTVGTMVSRYRRAGYSVSAHYMDTFQATFVSVRRGARYVLGGYARGRIVTMLGIPFIPVCE